MRTATKTAEKAQPALHKAQETLTDTVLPTVRDAFGTAREKGIEFLDSDLALEARRRGLAVVRAAKGEQTIATAPKRWRFGLGMVAFGGLLGLAGAWAARRFSTTTTETYSHTMPVPSGTDSGLTTDQATTTPATGSVEDIDLRSGAPTNR